MKHGPCPTGIVALTVLVAVEITKTVSLVKLATNSVVPPRVTFKFSQPFQCNCAGASKA
jgi:hypothetical protein